VQKAGNDFRLFAYMGLWKNAFAIFLNHYESKNYFSQLAYMVSAKNAFL